jgi:hypothetical protein
MPLQKKLCEIVLLIGLLQWNSDTQVRILIRILKIGSGSSDSSKGTVLQIHTYGSEPTTTLVARTMLPVHK